MARRRRLAVPGLDHQVPPLPLGFPPQTRHLGRPESKTTAGNLGRRNLGLRRANHRWRTWLNGCCTRTRLGTAIG
eukprot:2910367-Lingulodinium_polyedra.AAC.1